jgi:putative protease
VTPATELQLEQVYSRGLGAHFINGTDHQAVVNGRAPRHRGVLMGRVAQVSHEGVRIEPADAHSVAPLKPGDGVVFDAAGWRSPEEPEEGGRVFQVVEREGFVEVRFGNGAIDPGRIRRGDLLWRSSDPETAKAARPYIDPAAPLRRQPVRVRVTAREGAPLKTEWRVGGVAASVRSQAPLGAARDRAVTAEHLTAHLGRLGNTPYELAGLEAEIVGAPFAPGSLLNDLRRRAVEELQRLQSAPKPVEAGRTAALTGESACQQAAEADGPPRVHLLVRNPAQLDAALSLNPATITLDYLDLYGLRPSLERVRAAGIEARVASPRVLKPGEERIVDFLAGCGCAILVRSMGLLDALHGKPHGALTGDFSLNAANALTAAELLALGLERIAPTHDLNAAQVAELARQTGAARIEAIAYQHIPVFHTEHCVFCRFLSTGKSYRDCGRPCESHRVALRDQNGRAHPVLADVGCRNTVFGAEAQHAAAHLDDWMGAGVRHFRLEFAHESADQVEGVTRAFAEALAGRLPARELARRLQRLSPEGATEGSLHVPPDYLALPVLQ